MPISDLALVNPPNSRTELPDDREVSFIPMTDVSEDGQWMVRQSRRRREIGDGYSAFQEGDILFAKITPCMENGKGTHAIGLLNGVGFGSTEFHVLRAKRNADPRYLYHWLQSKTLRLKAEAMMTGSAGQRRVPADFFTAFKVPLLPLKSQRRIAEILDTIDAAIHLTEALIAKFKQKKAGLLHDLLTLGVDEHGQLRDPEAHPEQFKGSALGRIPRTWNVVSFVEITESAVDGPFGSNLKTEHYVLEPGVWVVRLQNVGTGRFDTSEEAFVSERHAAHLQRHQVTPGDLIVASLGDENHPIARACLYPFDLPPGIVKADCFRFRMRADAALNEYVMYVLCCPSTRRDINSFAQGVTRDRVNLTSLQQFRLRLPPLNEQRGIVSALSTHDRRIETEVRYRDKLKLIKQGLVDDLLTGRVRVNVAERAGHGESAQSERHDLQSLPR